MDGVTIPEASYRVMIIEEAKKLLRTMVVSEFLQGKFYLLGNKQYRKDFYLGDLVNCVDNKIGFESTLRISGSNEVWDTNGYSLSLTFGDDVPNIYQTIKLVTKGAK